MSSPLTERLVPETRGCPAKSAPSGLITRFSVPLDRVHDQADDPALRPNHHKLRTWRRGAVANSERVAGENDRDGLVAEQNSRARAGIRSERQTSDRRG